MEPSVLLLTVPTALGSSSALLPSVLYETCIPSFPLAVPRWLRGRVAAPSAKAVLVCRSRQAQTHVLCTQHPNHGKLLGKLFLEFAPLLLLF